MFRVIILGALSFLSTLYAFEIELESEVVSPRDGRVPSEVSYDRMIQGSPRGNYDLIYEQKSGEINGFSFEDKGINKIVPVEPAEFAGYPKRTFEFEFSERKRQDIQVAITDVPTEFLSHRMESYFYFFPRVNLPAILWTKVGLDPEQFEVVLPTGESVLFDKKTKNVVSGVLKENGPIDLGPDRFKRKFADVTYSGAGVVIRVDKRGNDPRFGTTAIVMKVGKKNCKISSNELFNQNDTSRAEFFFDQDADVKVLLQKKCGYSF